MRTSSTTLRAYLLLSPALLTVVLTLVVCLLVMVALSFWRQDYLQLVAAWTADNYTELVNKPVFVRLILRSIVVSGCVALVSVALAYPMAYFIAFDLKRSKFTWLLIVTLPFWISYLLRILSWKVILGFNGVINSSLIGAGVITDPIEALLYNPLSVSIALTHAWAPFALLPIYVSLEKIDRSVLEASNDLGDGPVKRFFRVTLPLSLPGVSAAALLIFIPTFGDYITPALIGGPNGFMIGNLIAAQFGASNNWPLGSAVACASMAIATIIACVFLAGTKRIVRIWA